MYANARCRPCKISPVLHINTSCFSGAAASGSSKKHPYLYDDEIFFCLPNATLHVPRDPQEYPCICMTHHSYVLVTFQYLGVNQDMILSVTCVCVAPVCVMKFVYTGKFSISWGQPGHVSVSDVCMCNSCMRNEVRLCW